MRSVTTAPAALALVLALAAQARADVPGFVDGPVFAGLCADVRRAADCPTCTCEAVTSTPSIGVTKDASDILDAVLVEVRGATTSGDKRVHEVRVFLGDETKLVDGGVVVDQSVEKGKDKVGTWEAKASQQLYVMCPGSCDWDAVGQVHVFEIAQTVTVPLDEPGRATEYSGSNLVACFEHDKKPGCWSVDLGTSQQELTRVPGSDAPKRGKKSTLQRTWKIGGKSGVELVLGAFSGTMLKEFAERSGREAKKKTMHFAELATWPDALRLGPE